MEVLTEKEEEVVKEIIEGARVVFEKFGLKKTTMEDIAREVGKAKSSLYYYFPGKHELFEAVVDYEIGQLFLLAQKAVDKAPTAKDKLKAYVKVRLSKIHKMGNLSQVVKNDLLDNMGIVMKIRKKHEVNQVGMIQKIIGDGVQYGEFKKKDHVQLCLIANLFAATFRGIELPLCANGFSDLAQKADDIIEVMVEGIGK